MKRRPRSSSTTLSFLDVLCNGMGACVLLFLIFGATEETQSAGATPTSDVVFSIAHRDPMETLTLRVRIGDDPSVKERLVPMSRRNADVVAKKDGGCAGGGRNSPTAGLPVIEGELIVFQTPCQTLGKELDPPATDTEMAVYEVIASVGRKTRVRFSVAIAQRGDNGSSTRESPTDPTTYLRFGNGKWTQLVKVEVGGFSDEVCLENTEGVVSECK